MTCDDLLITIDVDWASDEAVLMLADVLMAHGARATWFATHRSPAIEVLESHPELFEIGLHPNCLYGSTHGASERTVLETMRAMFPQARTMRTHGLYQSTQFLELAGAQFGVRYDSSMLLHKVPQLRPFSMHAGECSLVRVPYFWEDDVEMCDPAPALQVPGLKVFDFHPVHVAMNTTSLDRYQALKQRRNVAEWDRDFIEEHRQEGAGPWRLFRQLAETLAGAGATISDLAERIGRNGEEAR